jgi:nucleotide-binding universal stress UspA family protein
MNCGRSALLFLNILVGIDGSPSSQRALEYAIELARAENARLTLMTVAPPAASFIMLAGVMPEAMREELDKWAQGQLADAVRTVPDELNPHTVQGSGHPGPEIVKELKRGGYDLIVLGSRGRGRTQEGLLGSVNGYVHFHTHVPLLSVPDETEVNAETPQ